MLEILAAFSGALAVSSFIGFLVYRASMRGGRGRRFQAFVGGAVFFSVFLIALPILWLVGWRLPSTDMIGFSDVSMLSIQFVEADGSIDEVTLQFQPSVPDFEDFPIRFSLTNVASTTLVAELLRPSEKVVSLRTNDQCSETIPVIESRSAACATRSTSGLLETRWFATPHRAATTQFAISSNVLRLSEYSDTSVANVLVEGNRYCEYRHPDGRLWHAGSDRSNIRCVPVELNQQRSFVEVNHSDLSVDLSKGQVSFLVDIKTTLGISRRAYEWLALLGALTAGLMGSGWMWKLLDTRRAALDRSHQQGQQKEDRKTIEDAIERMEWELQFIGEPRTDVPAYYNFRQNVLTAADDAFGNDSPEYRRISSAFETAEKSPLYETTKPFVEAQIREIVSDAKALLAQG